LAKFSQQGFEHSHKKHKSDIMHHSAHGGGTVSNVMKQIGLDSRKLGPFFAVIARRYLALRCPDRATSKLYAAAREEFSM
jgi:hypothetical protein